MTRKTKFFCSLNTKVLLLLVASLAVGTLVYFGASAVGGKLVAKYYMSEEAVAARRTEVFNELKAYVLQNQLSSHDGQKLGKWTMSHPYVALVVRSDRLKIEAGSWGAVTSELPASGEKTFPELSGEGIYYLRFTDGLCQISISETSQEKEYNLCSVISVAIACAVVILIMFLYVHRLTAKVAALSKSAQAIGRGDLNREIYVKGRDELSTLGGEMNDMRLSIIRRIESERKAWQANSSLITAISHDLRTPMTSMIGYLELLKNGEYADDEQRARFTENAHAKAMELKELTDELFKYFLVYGASELPLELETYDAVILLEQLLGETVIELREAGYNVRVIRMPESRPIRVDALSLKRVFDNIFSNIKKYADMEKPVVVLCEIEDGKYISICISNAKKKSANKVESTKIGLQTCRRIVEQLGGTFKTGGDDDHFTAEVILPIYTGSEK